MGFSAGGEVACLAAMRFDDGDTSAVDPIDRLGCRPDFHALIYPGRSNRLKPIEASPPVFIACGYRDRPDISRGMAELYLRYKAADVSAELHIYSTAGHGFGLREGGQAAAGWESRMLEWMAAQRLYPRQAPPEG
jgi:endo-1,4-beta-xylanase